MIIVLGEIMSNVFDSLIEKARHTGKRIVLTESEDQRIIDAAKKAAAFFCVFFLLVLQKCIPPELLQKSKLL